MKSGLIIGLVFAAILGFLVVSLGLGYLSFTNTANSLENGIETQYKENQNIYSNEWKNVVEMAQVPAQQAETLGKIYLDAVKGTYGPNGSQALFQAMKERDINIDQTTYIKVQQSIETFHNKFEQAQREMNSRSQTYKNLLTATTSGRFFNMFAGYPHIDLDKYTTMVTDSKTESDFETKKSEPLDVFGKNK
jgi:hypothetical protein